MNKVGCRVTPFDKPVLSVVEGLRANPTYGPLAPSPLEGEGWGEGEMVNE